MKKDSKKTFRVIITILIVLFTLLFVFCIWKLVTINLSYAQNSREYEELRQFITVEEETVLKSEATPDWETDPAMEQETEESETVSAESSQEESEESETQTEEVYLTCPVTVDFETLWEVNPDIKGWIYLQETEISYPIVQGRDNDAYIYTSVKGTANSGGSIFMEALNSADFSDPHTIIYGHNMKDGSMFGTLKKLYDQERIDEINGPLCFWIITPESTYRYDVFSIHTVDITDGTYTLFAEQGDAVGEYMNKMARRTGIELEQRVYTAADKVITLSTCTGSDQHRLVVQGVRYVE